MALRSGVLFVVNVDRVWRNRMGATKIEAMDYRTQICWHGTSWNFRQTLLRRVGCLLTAASLLPVLALGPLGAGAILIHDHHEEDLHAHKINLGARQQPTASEGHNHSTENAVDLEGSQFVLTFPDLSRFAVHAQVSGPHTKLTLSPAVIGGITPRSLAICAADLRDRNNSPALLRAHDTMTNLLLLGGQSLLI